MDLRQLQSHWDTFGRLDPMWAILTTDEKRGGKWEHGEFFATGRNEIGQIVEYVKGLGMPKAWRLALDFGCGVGRLTQALAEHFDRATGVDIAPSMVEEARKHNRHGGRCEYHLNDRDDLSVFASGTFDLIYSNIVLQHMRPEYSRRYVREFVRVLAPGGVAVFQLPSEHRAAADTAGRSFPPALPGSAFRAEITPDPAAVEVAAGEMFTVRARVVNRGDAVWPVGRPGDQQVVRLANHWRDEAGNRSQDTRVTIPADVPPGADVVLALTTTAPLRPGRYAMDLNMMQEGVAWFADHGSPTATIPITVRPAASGPVAEASPFVPVMEMYGVPWLEVVQDVAAAGGAVLDIQKDPWAWQTWYSYRYCVTRRA
jgi:SAM-dependent methyltransferase